MMSANRRDEDIKDLGPQVVEHRGPDLRCKGQGLKRHLPILAVGELKADSGVVKV
jgi:hypothetical protein